MNRMLLLASLLFLSGCHSWHMPFVRRAVKADVAKTALQSSIALDEDWMMLPSSASSKRSSLPLNAAETMTTAAPQALQCPAAAATTDLPDVYLQPRHSDQARTQLVRVLSVAELQAGRLACVAAIFIFVHELITGGESMLLAMLQR